MRGRFITLEGGEGSGKSTLLKELAARLEAAGKTVVCTREPGGTALAESVRNLVLHPPAGQHWSPMAEALLMNTAIAQAKDPLKMAVAMRKAVEAGRAAYEAGRMPKRLYASASSPLDGTAAF